MKFVKSKFAQKLIIILIALMIFNIAIPKQVSAWDFGGILLKPISSLILSYLVSINTSIGIFLNGLSISVNAIGGFIESITGESKEALESMKTALEQLFIGPDSIFSGKVRILDANIFEVDPTQIISFETDGSSDVLSISELASAVSPGYDLIVSLKEGIATVYRALRDICGYIMLAGLIFTGIRILVSSNIPTKKTQYLMLLQDWLIGMVLLIFSHVIMIGVFYISDTLVKALSASLVGVGGLNFNLVVQCLFSLDSAEQIICLVMLGYLIYLTVIFGISYLKRLMWVCVLIVIAPVVSIMYAFGNSTKGIYSKWLREYIMTVLVQPFHLIVYYVLVSIPLNISNSTTGYSFTGDNLLEIIYCLVAISFIRPAEKYIRDLFGMGQGIAGQASFDSGKQTFDKAAKAVATVAVTAATAGVGGAAMGAIKGGTALKGLAQASKTVLGDGAFGKVAGKAIDGAEKALETGGKIGKRILFGKDPKSEAIDAGVGNGEEVKKDNPVKKSGEVKEDIVENTGGPSAANAFQNSEDPLTASLKESAAEKIADFRADELTQDEKSILTDEQKEEVERQEKALSPNKENIAEEELEKANASNVSQQAGDANNASQQDENASNVSQQAGDRLIEAADKLSSAADKLSGKEAGESKEEATSEEKESKETKKDTTDSEKVEIITGEEKESKVEDKQKKTLREKAMDTVEGKAEDLRTFMGATTGKKGVFDTLGYLSNFAPTEEEEENAEKSGKKLKLSSRQKLGKVAGQFMESDLGKSLQKFEDLGGFKQLHQGFNEVRDTFYVGGAPGDWKATNDRMGDSIKERQEIIKAEMTNINNNEWLVNIFADKLRAQYPDRVKYNDARIMDMAEEKAKSKLKSLADTYVPLGITDAKMAYECDKDCKQYSYRPKDAAEKRIEYEQKFNSVQSNVEIVNKADVNYGYGDNNQKVDQGIQGAREYYYNGYNDVGSMILVDQIATRIAKMPQFKNAKDSDRRKFAIKKDQELRKGGKVDYKGDDPKVAAVVKQINDIYKQ